MIVTYRVVKLDKVRMWPSLPLTNQPSAFSVIKHFRDQLVAWSQCGIHLLGGFWSKKNSLIWILIARQCISAQYLECTAPSNNKLGFKYPLPEHNLEAFRPNYKPMKLQLSVPELPTSAPYVSDNEGLGTVHTERTFECWNGLKNHNYGPPGKELNVRYSQYQVSKNCNF